MNEILGQKPVEELVEIAARDDIPVLLVGDTGCGKDELLGETAKTKLREIYIEEVFGRKKYDNINKYTQKGIMVESDSLELVSQSSPVPLFKNTKTLENDYLIGTPDVIKPTLVDIKSSWDIWTFMAVDVNKAKKDYYWQMAGYMWLVETFSAVLAYVLVDTPDEIMQHELYGLSYKMNEKQVEAAKNNYQYGDIDPKLRVKKYILPLADGDFEKIAKQLDACREYLSLLKLEESGLKI